MDAPEPTRQRGSISRREALRRAAAAGLGAVGAYLLAACGAVPSTGGGSRQATTQVTWLVRTGLAENKWERDVAVPQFEKQNPSTTINLIVAPNNQFDPKLFTLFAAGIPVDVWSHWGGSGFADYYYKGMLADMTPYLQADRYDLSAFLPGLLDIFKRQGRYMGIPNDTTFGMPLYYSVPMLKKAGVEPPPTNWDQPWTWQQFTDAGKKMTTSYGSSAAVYGTNTSTDLQLWARLGGNELFADEAIATGVAKPSDYRATTPETLAGAQALYDLIYTQKIMPTPQLSSAINSGGVDPFRGQRVAMNIDGGWQYWSYKPQIHNFTWAVGATPKLKTNTVTGYTDPWMLASDSREPEAAWKLITYLVSDAGQAAYSNATGAPPAKTSVVERWWQDFTKPTGLTVDQLKEVTLGALKHAKESFNHLIVDYAEIINAETQSTNQIWTGKLSPKEGLAEAKQRVDAVLQTIH